MKLYEVPLTLAEHDSDIKIKVCTKKLSFCAYNFAQISGERLQDHRFFGFVLILGPDIRWVFTGPLLLWFNVDIEVSGQTG